MIPQIALLIAGACYVVAGVSFYYVESKPAMALTMLFYAAANVTIYYAGRG